MQAGTQEPFFAHVVDLSKSQNKGLLVGADRLITFRITKLILSASDSDLPAASRSSIADLSGGCGCKSLLLCLSSSVILFQFQGRNSPQQIERFRIVPNNDS